MDEKMIAYCGLCCEHCYSRTHIWPTAQTLMDQMKRQGFENFGPYMPDFKEFWAFLGTLIEAEGCQGCGNNGGSPSCQIRLCAREKGIQACPLCDEYPCEKFDWLKGSIAYPMLSDDNLLMRHEGLAAWEAMQQAHRQDSFTYVEARESQQ